MFRLPQSIHHQNLARDGRNCYYRHLNRPFRTLLPALYRHNTVPFCFSIRPATTYYPTYKEHLRPTGSSHYRSLGKLALHESGTMDADWYRDGGSRSRWVAEHGAVSLDWIYNTLFLLRAEGIFFLSVCLGFLCTAGRCRVLWAFLVALYTPCLPFICKKSFLSENSSSFNNDTYYQKLFGTMKKKNHLCKKKNIQQRGFASGHPPNY
jgi:hypothetical protein